MSRMTALLNSQVIAERTHSTLPLTVRITKTYDGKYSVVREDDKTPAYRWNSLSTVRDTEPEARKMANFLWADAVARSAPKAEVPAGRYALGSGADMRFYKVDRPTEGRWAGRVFVKILASDTEYPVRGKAAQEVLSKIGADLKNASLKYGQNIGACGVCGRTLTDADSRERGIGPVCVANMGW